MPALIFNRPFARALTGLLLLALLAACTPAASPTAASPTANVPGAASMPATATLPVESAPMHTAAPTLAPTTETSAAQPGETATVGSPAGQTSGQGLSFANDPSLFSSATIEVVPASQTGNDVPFWEVLPQYTLATLEGYPLSGHMFKPQIFIYPVEIFKEINPGAEKIISDLQTLLADKPDNVQNVPFLPLFNAAQVFHAQMKYMDFGNGTGVRFLTQFDQAPLPINNHELFYAYQGLTSDGNWYVAAVLPVNLPALPADNTVTPTQAATFGQGFPQYIAGVAQQLEGTPDAGFTPDLSKLDALIASLEVK